MPLMESAGWGTGWAFVPEPPGWMKGSTLKPLRLLVLVLHA